MKKLILLFLLSSFVAQAQITAYTNATIDIFGAIGGYTYYIPDFPNVQNPYSLSGPLPQKDFTFVATSPQGLKGVLNDYHFESNAPNQPITITFKGNKVRKMSCILNVGENIQLTATSNLGNTVSVTGGLNSSNNFRGFNVQGDNEYLTQVEFAAPIGTNNRVRIEELVIGDNTPQNTALNFDGVNDYVGIHYSIGNFDYFHNFVVTCWVKIPSTNQPNTDYTDNDILEKWDFITARYPFVIRYLNHTDANSGKIKVARYDGTNNPSITSSITVNDDKWHHIAFVKSNTTLTLYIDGTSSGTTTDNTTATTTNNSQLFVGRRGGAFTNYFKGKIDEVRIWTASKTQLEIQAEMFCKTPNTTNLQAAFNFNNGTPNGNNQWISTVPNAVNVDFSAFLFNFDKTGDASNFVTGQVKYVKANATGGNNGSSWANAYTDLQSALPANTCNDLFDVYVATGKYKPHASNKNSSFNIQAGMKIYGGFAGTEKNINERDMALIHTTNKTSLSGDLDDNDTPFVFDFNINNNAFNVVKIIGDNVIIDGFTVRGGQTYGLNKEDYSNFTMNNCRVIDNINGLFLKSGYSILSNSIIAGNNSDGISINNNSQNIINCLIANNGFRGIFQHSGGASCLSNLTNCTIVSNRSNSILNNYAGGSYQITNNIKNTIIKDNGGGINDGTGITNNITYSLVQGVTSGTGNLDGNTVNPQFVNPLPNTAINDAGNYRLKWCSYAISGATNIGISPFDLDRNPRYLNNIPDMGAYEFFGNQVRMTNTGIAGTIDSPIYDGGTIQTLNSINKILAPAGAINFKAPNSITLNPGFEARGVSKYFKAEIGANVGCTN